MDRRDDDVGKVVPEERISHRPGDMNAGGMHHRSSLRCEEAGTPLDEEHVDRPNDERAKHVSVTSQADHRHHVDDHGKHCLLYTSPSPRDRTRSRMPSSA